MADRRSAALTVPSSSGGYTGQGSFVMTYRRVSCGLLAVALAALIYCAEGEAARPPGQQALPNKPNTLHFAVIGDNGTGEKPEYEVGAQMLNWYNRFPF